MEQELKNEGEVLSEVIGDGAEKPKEVAESAESVDTPAKESEKDEAESEATPAEEPAKEETNGVSEKNGTTTTEPKENGEKNGLSKENIDGDLKRKSGTVDTPEIEVSAEKKAKLAEEADVGVVEAAENGVETN